MSKKRIKLSVSDQVRKAVDDSDMTRYRIAKLSGIDQGTFSNFMAGKRGLRLSTFDTLVDVLDLELTPRRVKKKAIKKEPEQATQPVTIKVKEEEDEPVTLTVQTTKPTTKRTKKPTTKRTPGKRTTETKPRKTKG